MTTRRLSLITSTKRKKYGLGVSGALLKMSGSVHHFAAYLEADDFSRQPESFQAFTEINLLYQGFRATLSFPRGFSKIFFFSFFWFQTDWSEHQNTQKTNCRACFRSKTVQAFQILPLQCDFLHLQDQKTTKTNLPQIICYFPPALGASGA